MVGLAIRSGDSNMGAGYGTLKSSAPNAASKREETWPYIALTDLEKQSNEDEDDEELNRRSINKKNKKVNSLDRIGQLNYRSNSFVNGATRGLTGIMSGMDPKSIIEQIIDEVRPMNRLRKGDEIGSIMGQKPIGLGAPQFNAMHPSGALRTRPGQGYGSKKGWFSPPQPKETDPSNFDHKFSLQDIANSAEEKPMKFANIERSKAIRKQKKALECFIRELLE